MICANYKQQCTTRRNSGNVPADHQMERRAEETVARLLELSELLLFYAVFKGRPWRAYVNKGNIPEVMTYIYYQWPRNRSSVLSSHSEANASE